MAHQSQAVAHFVHQCTRQNLVLIIVLSIIGTHCLYGAVCKKGDVVELNCAIRRIFIRWAGFQIFQIEGADILSSIQLAGRLITYGCFRYMGRILDFYLFIRTLTEIVVQHLLIHAGCAVMVGITMYIFRKSRCVTHDVKHPLCGRSMGIFSASRPTVKIVVTVVVLAIEIFDAVFKF